MAQTAPDGTLYHSDKGLSTAEKARRQALAEEERARHAAAKDDDDVYYPNGESQGKTT